MSIDSLIKIVGMIPARFASSRLPGKPLISIRGKTLLQRTFENARRASMLDNLLVATDDSRIFEHVREFGGHAVMTSVECPTGTDRLAEVLRQYPEWLHARAVVNIQGDEPCLDPAAIDATVKLLLDNPEISMATLVSPLEDEEEASNPSVVKCVMDQYQNALFFSRNLIPSNKKRKFNSREGLYYRHIGLYVYRPSFLLRYQELSPTPLQLEEDLEHLKVLEHGYRIKVAITHQAGIGVDTPEDLPKVEEWLCKQNISL